MKKFMFTAIAMIAFVGTSMAETGDKQIRLNTFIKFSSELLDCKGIAHDTYFIWISRGASEDIARTQSKKAKSDCEAENKLKKLDKHS